MRTPPNLAALLADIPALARLAMIASCDFGHTTPIFTVPIGGRCRLEATAAGASIELTRH